jgi:hypothetical protein
VTTRRQWIVLSALASLYLIALGAVIGVVSERFRFDGTRNRIVSELQEATLRVRTNAMLLEQRSQIGVPATGENAAWTTHLDTLNAALKSADVDKAERAWRDAQGAALRTRAWLPLVEVADAALRIATVTGPRASWEGRAREMYMRALGRARADRSVDGALRVGKSFDALGDYDVAEQCRLIAEAIARARDDTASLSEDRVVDVRAAPRTGANE